jgi:hypothetical protein
MDRTLEVFPDDALPPEAIFSSRSELVTAGLPSDQINNQIYQSDQSIQIRYGILSDQSIQIQRLYI